ncbi:MAG: hypothetical protein FJ096_03745 [Deltaproteobacteria bacterium]|nr:hypothetical protein [Deltaproteobacteria bacterium]
MLTRPWTPWVALVVSLVLLAPTLGHGLRMDDRWLRAMSVGDPRFPEMLRAPHRLFAFYDGPETLAFLRKHGVNPWFADDEVRLNFFRPLASLLHFAEFRLLGASTWAMHAISLAAYGLLVVVVHRFLVRFFGREGAPAQGGIAGFATALYALDGHHGIVAGWLAQRNSILAAIFGVLAIDAHDRAVRDDDRRARVRAPIFVLLGLWSAEAGIATAFALVAHALTLTPPGRRLRSLGVHLVPHAIWAAGYVVGGHGVHGSGMYLDLAREPLHALSHALLHWPVLVSLNLGNQLADFWVMISDAQRVGAVVLGLGFVAAFASAIGPQVVRDASSRFLALAAVLTLIPPCGTQPMGRLVLFSGVFMLPLVAGALLAWLEGTLEPWRPARHLAFAFLPLLALYRVVASPLLLANGARSMVVLEDSFGSFAASLPEDPTGATTVLVVNAPDLGFFGYLPMLAAELGRKVPAAFPLANGNRTVTLRGLDADSFSVRCDGGFVRSATDQLSRSAATPLRLGASFRAGPLTFTVTHLDAVGRADEARVDAALPLDDPRLRWLAWEGSRLVPVAPPIGPEPRVFAAQSFFQHLIETANRPSVHVPGG